MRQSTKTDEKIITALYKWLTTYKGSPTVKDTTKLYNTYFDFYLDSPLSDPLSFTVFEMSDKGELLIDKPQKIIESNAAFFLFVNVKTGWISAIKNTSENRKKLIRQEDIQNLKVRIIL